MKKFFISAALIAVFAAYVTYTNVSTSASAQQPVTVSAVPATSDTNSVSSSATESTTAAGSAPPITTTTGGKKTPATTVTATPVTTVAKGQYTDGTYTGSAANAYYGNIQVAATISGGKLTNVTFLQYPNDRSTSRYINQQAMPELKAEAIQAQSANVDGVSGASDSSAAFKQSLASALSQAAA